MEQTQKQDLHDLLHFYADTYAQGVLKFMALDYALMTEPENAHGFVKELYTQIKKSKTPGSGKYPPELVRKFDVYFDKYGKQ